MSRTGPDAKTRLKVWQRAQGCCESCGRVLGSPDGPPAGGGLYSLQHRLARGAGGTRNPAINRPSNLLLLCGSATSLGCHLRCERRDPMAEADGLWIRRGQEDPADVPVRLPMGRWVLLDDQARYRNVPPLDDRGEYQAHSR